MAQHDQSELVPEAPRQVLRHLPNKRINNQSVARLASSFMYFYDDARTYRPKKSNAPSSMSNKPV